MRPGLGLWRISGDIFEVSLSLSASQFPTPENSTQRKFAKTVAISSYKVEGSYQQASPVHAVKLFLTDAVIQVLDAGRIA